MTFREEDIILELTGSLVLVLCLTVLTPPDLSLTDFLNTTSCKLMHMDALKHYKINHIFSKLIREIINLCSIFTPFRVHL